MAKPYKILVIKDTVKFDEYLQSLYDEFNRDWFDGSLPYVRVGWSVARKDKKRYYGSTLQLHGHKFPYYIQINPVFKNWNDTVCLTLLHEMVHVKFGVRDNENGHGPKFKKEIRRLAQAGAFDKYL